jgi:hypothetical protein
MNADQAIAKIAEIAKKRQNLTTDEHGSYGFLISNDVELF